MNEPTALDILKAARGLITNPKDWGQGCRPERLSCRTYCAGEAIEECLPGHSIAERHRAFRALKNAAGVDDEWGELIRWNDRSSHQEVLAAFNLAIATLRLR